MGVGEVGVLVLLTGMTVMLCSAVALIWVVFGSQIGLCGLIGALGFLVAVAGVLMIKSD